MLNSLKPVPTIFKLILKELDGEPVLDNPVFEYHYDWNEDTGERKASLKTVNGTPVNVELYPLEGNMDFVSDMEPTNYAVNISNDKDLGVKDIVIYRVILDVNFITGKRSAAIMFHDDGSVIQISEGFAEEDQEIPMSE